MESVETPGTGAYCLFPYRSSVLAVGLAAVETLIEAARLVRLPLCPPPLSNLCPYRGGFLPVARLADDREVSAAGPGAGGRRPAVLVLRTGHGPLGLLID